MRRAAQPLHPLHGDGRRPLALDLRSHCAQALGEVHDLRLPRGVLQHRRALRDLEFGAVVEGEDLVGDRLARPAGESPTPLEPPQKGVRIEEQPHDHFSQAASSSSGSGSTVRRCGSRAVKTSTRVPARAMAAL